MSTKQNILEALELARELIEGGFDRENMYKHVEFFDGSKWHVCKTAYNFNPLDGYKYRRKQKTITVNGVEVPAPLSEPPQNNTKCFYYSVFSSEGYDNFCWQGHMRQITALENGIYTNEQDIKQYVKALWGE